MNSFKNHHAVVIGAGRGIGQASAVELAKSGCGGIALVDISFGGSTTEAEIQELGLGIRVKSFIADQSRPEQVDAVVKAVTDYFGAVPSILVHTAVYSERASLITASVEGIRRTLEISLFGTALMVRGFGAKMCESGSGGSMVIVSSPHADMPFPASAAYNMTRAGVDSLIGSAATEWLRKGVRVNGVKPGWVDTPGELAFFSRAEMLEGAKKTPLGRLLQPHEIARVVRFIADPENVCFNGTIVDASAGIMGTAWYSNRGESGQF